MIIWAFSGLGKTELAKFNPEYVDADVRRYMFCGIEENAELHGAHFECVPNTSYPQNYISYVRTFESDTNRHVLVNCSLALCKNFKDVLFIYPSIEMRDAILNRYKKRNDQREFIENIQHDYKDMIDALNHYPSTKKIVVRDNKYLSDMKGEIETMLMTKNDLVSLLQKGIDLNILNLNNGELSCAVPGCLSNTVTGVYAPEDVAMRLFEGTALLNTTLLEQEITKAQKLREIELKKEDNRQGYTSDEIENLLMDAMVYGVATPYYGEVAPYSHGYEFRYTGKRGVDFYNLRGFYEIPHRLREMIEDGKYNIDLHKLEAEVKVEQEAQSERTGYETSADLHWSLDGWNRHIHSLGDVHKMRGLDAIVRGKCFGTYSNCMASGQNDLIIQMVTFKGYCLDYLLSSGREECLRTPWYMDALNKFHARHGLDISTPERIEEWARKNPEATLNRDFYRKEAELSAVRVKRKGR